ncbi:uncharacterized protein PAC_15545 [Phialocephala subalpina]|uniref:Zn(2)-C6 fungal-type domain-containing protein n=1 Tax=Phialocephala subalpina TaxID=576137 RepID=A0A1L7XKQ6_9HELO|nr:uncharacterized protein PAC_15545 [Phialocephala subalpina]
MTSHRRRGRGKRPRDDPDETASQSFAPINPSAQPASSYTNSTFGQSQSSHPDTRSTEAVFSRPQSQLGNISQVPHGKVAIPALRPPPTAESTQGNKKGRTSHACDYCRKAKAGCTGGQPCMRCKNANVECVYGDGKRDRERKKLSKLSKETVTLNRYNADILDALRRIRLDTSLDADSMRTAMDEVLSMTPTPVTPKAGDEASSESPQLSPRPEDGSGGEDQDSNIGSTGSLDVVNVDPDRDETRATGHMGKASSVAWAKRTAVEYDTKTLAQQGSTLGTHQSGYTLASYHTEDADVEFVDMSNINEFDWPDYETADVLLGLYFENVHGTLPLVDREKFTTKYHDFPRGSEDLSSEDRVWLGTLNLIFAISAFYAQLIKRHDCGHHHDHLIYLKRAKVLCLDEDLLFKDARVSTARVLGLLCLYFISTCRLNRAWTICGLAIRQALTLGLQVRSHAESLSDYDKEQRVRLWWCLYTLECLLNELTGRPSCISDQDISAVLPLNINEHDIQGSQFMYSSSPVSEQFSRRASRGSRSSDSRPTATYQMPAGIPQPLIHKFPALSLPVTNSTYFIYRVQLCIVSHEIVTQLYCAATTKAKWSSVQSTIKRIDSRLLSWRDTLPSSFNITFDSWTSPDLSSPNILQRLGLAMIFNSSRMILFRPCLCRFERRVESHSKESKDFNQEAAEICIHSARTMINLIHWCSSSVEKLYAITPWWNTLHCLCEALSVLMLEMAFQAQHLPSEAAYILEDAKNGIRWLCMMAGESVSARKAWEIFDCLIRLVAPMISWSVYDMPTEAPIPPGYNWRRFNVAQMQELGGREMTGRSQLSEANLQEYEDTQRNVDHPVATSAWNQDQNFGFSTAPDSHFGPASGSEPQGVGGGGGGGGAMGGRYEGHEQVSNPLDHTTAVERFGSIGRVHGHYDEPWQHMFVASSGLGFGDGSDGLGMGTGVASHDFAGVSGQGQGQGGFGEYGGDGISGSHEGGAGHERGDREGSYQGGEFGF